jgi:hypothetical protein
MEKETIEEAADLWATDTKNVHPADSFIAKQSFIKGAKWQAERMYSEEEVYDILVEHTIELFKKESTTLNEWFEKYKKK